MDAIVSFSIKFFLLRLPKKELFLMENKTLSVRSLAHSYKSHGSGLAPWLPGHSQLSMAWRGGFMVFLFGVSVLYNMHHEGPGEEP